MNPRPVLHLFAAVSCLVSLAACSKEEPKKEPEPAGSNAPVKSEAKPTAPPTAAKKPAAKSDEQGYPAPIGPQLVLIPGKGVGPIRFGATFETVERLMGAPCDVRTETRCGYIRQAIEFTMKEGAVDGMKAQRRNRKVSSPPPKKDKLYGAFNGLMRPQIMMGLHQHVVVEEFGEPKSKEPLKGSDGQVESYIYDGVKLEFDKLENGNTILAAIEITPSKTAPLVPKLEQNKAPKK